MRIKRFNESIDDCVINPIKFNNSKGVEKIVYPSVLVEISGKDGNLLSSLRKEMDDLMFNQGFLTPPKFIDIDTGNVLEDRLRYTVKNPRLVFFVEEKNLSKAKEIADKLGYRSIDEGANVLFEKDGQILSLNTAEMGYFLNSSVTTSSCGYSRLTARTASATGPCGSHADEPVASLVSGIPKSKMPPIRASTARCASLSSSSTLV
jgi:hypothetical protein